MIGQLVKAKAGHDKDALYVVFREAGEFVFLCDGKTKTPDKCKKKSRKHIQPINAFVSRELIEKIEKNETIYPEEIKFEIKKYLISKDKK